MLVVDQWRQFSQWFWNPTIWCPPNTTWTDYEDDSRVTHAHFSELYWAIPTAVALFLIRCVLEKYIYTPVGVSLGLKKKAPYQKPADNEVLENYFKSQLSLTNGTITSTTREGGGDKFNSREILGLAKQTDLTERQVERWLRKRRGAGRVKTTTLTKFTECAWRCNYYFVAFAYGLYVLHDKEWLWDSINCFVDYPHHHVTRGERWLYQLELGFYLSLLVSQFFDVKRKDFWQMFIHHIITICLLGFSWACQLHRIGTLVQVIHDFADIPLEAAKMAKYVKRQRLADFIFVIFTIAWITSRCGLYPYRVIYYSSHKALDIVPMFPAYYIFNSLLCALQLLHIIWTILIIRIAIMAVNDDGIKDLRSDDEDSSEEAEDRSSDSGSTTGGNGTQQNNSNSTTNSRNSSSHNSQSPSMTTEERKKQL